MYVCLVVLFLFFSGVCVIRGGGLRVGDQRVIT